MHGAPVEVVKPWQHKKLPKKETLLPSAAKNEVATSPSSMAKLSPINEHRATVEFVKPWQQKELAKKEAMLPSATKKEITTSRSSMANMSPVNKETGERKKTKFCMYHLQGVCMYASGCAFAHTVEEMHGARGSWNERPKIVGKRDQRRVSFESDVVTPFETDLPVKPIAIQPQQPQPQSHQQPIAAAAVRAFHSQGNVRDVQPLSAADRNTDAWPKMDEPMYVQPSMLDNPIGGAYAKAEKQLCGMGLSTECAQILSMPPLATLQMSF